MAIKKKAVKTALTVLVDLVVAAAILLTFCYFHHVRILWGDNGEEEHEIIESFPKDENNNDDKPAPHLTHAWVLVEKKDADCTNGGYTKYTCECGDEKYADRTEAKGHGATVVKEAVEATKEENGNTGDTVCTVCNEVLVPGREIPATKHENIQLMHMTESTCCEHGYTGDWFCYDLECQKIVAKGTVAPLADHSYVVDTVVGADCKSEGYTVNICDVCGVKNNTNYVPRVDHSMNNKGYCMYCALYMADTSGDFGESFPLRFMQDDTIVELSDDTEIRKYAAEHEIELQDHPDGKFLHLYRSHDVYVSLIEVRTTLYNGSKSYKVKYFVYDVYVRNLENLFTVNTTGKKSVPTLIGRGEEENGGDIIATINGDYTGNKNHCLVAVRNGDVIRKSDYIESDIGVLCHDGNFVTFTPETYNWEAVSQKSPYQIWNFGPSLLDASGKAITSFSNESYDGSVIGSRNPRSAFGYYEPGHYSMMTVDGRSGDSVGIIMVQLARLFEELGCVSAYNMDGGDSAQAYYRYDPIRIDEDKLEDGEEQRKLFDIICVGEVKKSD